MMRRTRYAGNPNVAVFATASERLALTAIGTDAEFVGILEKVLDVPVIQMPVAGSIVVGSLVAMNSNGIVVTGLADDDELSILPEGFEVLRIDGQYNASGNNILTNDNGAIISPGYSEEEAKWISDALGVEVVRSSIAGVNTVGSVCRATNKGCLCHVDASDEEVELINSVLKVEAVRTTVNHGVRAVGAGVIANSKGAIIGDETTPIELGRIEEGLVLY